MMSPKEHAYESSAKKVMVKPLHAGISVSDMETSIAWYRDMLGFSLVSIKYIPPLKAKIAFMEQGDFSIELFEPDESMPLPEERRHPNQDILTCGNKHVAYAVEDIQVMMHQLKSGGVDVAKDVFQMEGDLVAFIRDNTGNLIELIQREKLFKR